MSNHIPPRYHAALVSEIQDWQSNQIITTEQASTLIGLYPTGAQKSNAVTILTVVGAVLVGLGTLLYVGANWQALATVWKIALIVAAVVGAHIAGIKFKFDPGDRPKLGSACFLLGSFFYGAGIWLIAQMFNVDINYPDGLALWLIGTAGSALVTRSVSVGVLTSILLALWSIRIPELGRFDYGDLHMHSQMLCGSIVGLFLAWHLRSRAMTWVTTIITTLWVMIVSGAGTSGFLFWGFFLIAAYLLSEKRWPLARQAFKYTGLVSTLSTIIFLTCTREASIQYANLTAYSFILCSTITAFAFVWWKQTHYRNFALACLLMLGYFLIFASNGNELTRTVAFNLLAIGSIAGLIGSGAKILQSPGVINTSLVFAVIYIISRYFDFFFSMMDRSLFFILGGVVLIVLGGIAERSRRQLIGGMAG